MTVTEGDKWAAQQLRARREKKKLTQERLADLAEIDRSAYNALENGRRKITPTYAERLAPYLGLSDHRTLLPPADQPKQPDDPLSRLAELEAEVAWLREWVARGFETLGVAPELQAEARQALGDRER